MRADAARARARAHVVCVHTHTHTTPTPHAQHSTPRGVRTSTLHGDHLVRGEVIAHIRRAGAVCDEAALEAPVVGLAHRGVHAHVSGGGS